MTKTNVVVIEAADWDQLWQELHEATRQYRSTENPLTQREALSDALSAICNLLRDYNTDGIEPVTMLTELLGDFNDLREGRRPKRLEPADAVPTRRTTDNDLADQAAAVATIDFLLDAGESLKVAARRVARVAKRNGRALPKPQNRSNKDKATDDWVRLINWRKELGQARSGDKKYQLALELRAFWRKRRDDWIAENGADHRAAAEAMMRLWIDMYQAQKV